MSKNNDLDDNSEVINKPQEALNRMNYRKKEVKVAIVICNILLATVVGGISYLFSISSDEEVAGRNIGLVCAATLLIGGAANYFTYKYYKKVNDNAEGLKDVLDKLNSINTVNEVKIDVPNIQTQQIQQTHNNAVGGMSL